MMKVQHAIDNDKRAPTELRKEQAAIEHELSLADAKTLVARTHVDDEYEEARYRKPKLLITTSRNPS